jgi:hypothetical protein
VREIVVLLYHILHRIQRTLHISILIVPQIRPSLILLPPRTNQISQVTSNTAVITHKHSLSRILLAPPQYRLHSQTIFKHIVECIPVFLAILLIEILLLTASDQQLAMQQFLP